jgi:hypothetical protein
MLLSPYLTPVSLGQEDKYALRSDAFVHGLSPRVATLFLV